MPSLVERLTRAITTATNDDYSELGSEKRARHIERLEILSDARDALGAAALSREERSELQSLRDWKSETVSRELGLSPRPSDDVRSALADEIGTYLNDAAILPGTPSYTLLFKSMTALRSAPVSGPDFEVAARALGFAKLPSGKWYSPNPSVYVNTASTFDKAEDIFEWWGRASGNASAPAVRVAREAIARTVRTFIDSALRWHPVFDDGRGGNDLTLDQTAALICERLAAAICSAPDATVSELVAIEAWSIVEQLRAPEGAEVGLFCDNPEGPPNNKIEVCSDWTGWGNRPFKGDTILDALRAALQASKEAPRG